MSSSAEELDRESAKATSSTTTSLDKKDDHFLFSSSKTVLDRPVLATLDLIALLVFAAVGKASHAAGDGTSILQEATAVVLTASPFIASWLGTSFVTGVYQTMNLKINGEGWLAWSWKQTIQGWIVAIPLGCVGRGLIKGYFPPIPFVIVTMVATLVILGLTRTAYHFVVIARNQTK
jgi:hypothetical protein